MLLFMVLRSCQTVFDSTRVRHDLGVFFLFGLVSFGFVCRNYHSVDFLEYEKWNENQ